MKRIDLYNLYFKRTAGALLMCGLLSGCGSTDDVAASSPTEVTETDDTVGGSADDTSDSADAAGDTTGATEEDTGSGDTSDTDSTTPDTTPGDDSGQPTDSPACDRVGFAPTEEIAEIQGGNYLYTGIRGPEESADYLRVSSYAEWNGPDGPGTYRLTGINYRECGLCLLMWSGCDSESCDKTYYANEGVVQIDSIGGTGTPFIATFNNVVFKEVQILTDYTSVEVENGERWCMDGHTIDQVFGAGTTINDPDADDDSDVLPPDGDEPVGPEPPADDTGSTDPADDDGTIDTDCQLSIRAEVRDESGPCTTCTEGDYITVAGVIENTCDRTLVYQSEKDCTVSAFLIENLTSRGEVEYVSTCFDGAIELEIAPGARIEQTRPTGRLSAGTYQLSAQFENEERTERVISFSVE